MLGSWSLLHCSEIITDSIQLASLHARPAANKSLRVLLQARQLRLPALRYRGGPDAGRALGGADRRGSRRQRDLAALLLVHHARAVGR